MKSVLFKIIILLQTYDVVLSDPTPLLRKGPSSPIVPDRFLMEPTEAPVEPTPAPTPPPVVVTLWTEFRPPTCLAEGQQCYRTTNGETENRFNTCCKRNGLVTMTCQGGPWDAVCTRVSGSTSDRLPRLDPKGNNWGLIDVSRAGSAKDSCPNAANLGPLLSKSTGFTSVFPPVTSTDLKSRGRESEIAFFVGGNYVAEVASDIEGNIVVLGDFINGAKGLQALGT